MRQILPTLIDDIDVEHAYLDDQRQRPGPRPWTVVNTAISADGATTKDGRSAGLTGPVDRLAFHALRAAADIILVGAGTARTEHYGPPVVHPNLAAARRLAGRESPPRMALVTRSLDLDLDSAMFHDAASRPIIVTIEGHDAEHLDPIHAVADVMVMGAGDVDLARTLDVLGSQGARMVLIEGGPTINGQLIAADLIDEWCLTIGPELIGGTSHRAAFSPPPGVFTKLRLDRVIVDENNLLLRYLTQL